MKETKQPTHSELLNYSKRIDSRIEAAKHDPAAAKAKTPAKAAQPAVTPSPVQTPAATWGPPTTGAVSTETTLPTPVAVTVNPTDKCPCGSNKQFKNCHGKPNVAPAWNANA